MGKRDCAWPEPKPRTSSFSICRCREWTDLRCSRGSPPISGKKRILIVVLTSLTVDAGLNARFPPGTRLLSKNMICRVSVRREAARRPHNDHAAAPLVLNVDDNEAQRYIKTRDLRLSGFAVVEAATGAEALRLVERDKPQVVLLDVQLPDIMGPEVCDYIKRWWSEVMVLMSTSNPSPGSSAASARSRRVGQPWVAEPAEQLELAAAVNSLLRIRKSEDDLRSLNATLEKKVVDRTNELREINLRLTEEIRNQESQSRSGPCSSAEDGGDGSSHRRPRP